MIIGVVGFAGSGKGTVGNILCKDYGFKAMSFADTLKDGVSTVFGWPRDLLEGDTAESRDFREKPDEFWSKALGKPMTPRLALQKFGTEAMRGAFGENFWVHCLAKKIHTYRNVVITDVRYPNEIKFIRDSGGFVVRVVRGPEPEWYEAALLHNTGKTDNRMLSEYINVHSSEWAWIGSSFDYQIANDGTLSQLDAVISHMMKIFVGPTGKNQS